MATKRIEVTVTQAVWQRSKYTIEVPVDMESDEYEDAYKAALTGGTAVAIYEDDFVDEVMSLDTEYEFEEVA